MHYIHKYALLIGSNGVFSFDGNMHYIHKYALLIGGLIALASCGSLHSVTDTPSSSASKAPFGSYLSLPDRYVPAKVWHLVHTDIDISFNLPARTATATAVLQMHPYFYDTDSVTLDAKGMKIAYVVLQHHAVVADPITGEEWAKPISDTLNFQYNGKQLCLKLPETFRKQDTVQLTIRYTAMPYAQNHVGSEAISSDRGLYFINTDGFEPYQPMQIWTQGETEANSHWFPTFDHPNFRSTFTITMHVPDSFKTLSNGALTHSVEEDKGMRADTWEQDIAIPPYLVMMAAGNFAVASDSSWQGKPVTYYVPQSYQAYAKDIFKHTPEMIDFFSRRLGVDFPWNKYSQIIGYDYVSGAMENVSASLFGAFNLKDKRELADAPNDYIVAHELFHQWFGDYVTCENWSQITLNESFADFSEKLWAEYKYGAEASEIAYYHSKLRYLGQAVSSDLPLLRHRYEHPDDVFDRVSYSKGGLVLNYLRMLAGDQAFFKALHLYLTQNALQSAEVSQLRLAFEQVTGEDWQRFFHQWYDQGGHPVLDISYRYDDAAKEMTVKVAQVQQAAAYQTSVYHLPLKAQIIRGHQLTTIDYVIDSQRQTFVFPYNGSKRPVFIPDAGHWLPGVVQEHKDATQWREQYFAGLEHLNHHQEDDYPDEKGFLPLNYIDVMSRHDALLGLSRAGKSGGKDITDSIFKVAIEQDPSPFIRLTAINLLVNRNNSGSEDMKNLFFKVAQQDKDNQVKTAAINWLGQQADKQYRNFFEQETDAYSYGVAAAALHALNKLDHHRAEAIARRLWDKNNYSAAWLTTAGFIIGQNGDPKDYPFFTHILWHQFEGDRALFMSSFSDYLLHVTSDSVYEQGLALIGKLADKEGPDSRFQIQMYATVYDLYQSLDRRQKAASDKTERQRLQGRCDAAYHLWQRYTHSVKNENTRKQILAITGN